VVKIGAELPKLSQK